MNPASLLILSLVAASAHAASPRVIASSGSVQFKQKEVKAGDELAGAGDLVTGAGARARIEQEGSVIQLGPEGRIALNGEEQTLTQGTARFRVTPLAGKPRVHFLVKTRAAVMGVRGTDFMSVANPLLEETELVVFEGKVEFTNASDRKDTKLVPGGHWGGIGGRFGNRISNLIHLPDNVLRAFDQATGFR